MWYKILDIKERALCWLAYTIGELREDKIRKPLSDQFILQHLFCTEDLLAPQWYYLYFYIQEAEIHFKKGG